MQGYECYAVIMGDDAVKPERGRAWLVTIRSNAGSLLKTITPVLSWLFVAFAVYFLIGATLFPGWWKRFIYDAGFADSRFWIAAWLYLVAMVREGLPLGLVLAVAIVIIPCYLLFLAGRLGPRKLLQAVKTAPRAVLLLSIMVIILTCVGLTAVDAEYQTPDELHAAVEQATARLQNPNSFRTMFRPSPPKSGFFIYLDPPKLARAYNTLQKRTYNRIANTNRGGCLRTQGYSYA